MNRVVATVSALVVAVGCGGGGGHGGGTFTSPNSQTIGPSGGTFTVTQGSLAGTTVTVPSGALSTNTTITVNPAATQISAPNVTNMGTTATIGPAGTNFTTPITVTLPFPVTALDPGMTAENVLVVLSSPSGLVEITPDSVDLAAGTVTFKTSTLGDFVVGKRPKTRKLVVTSGAVAPSAGLTIAPPITVAYQDESGTLVTSETFPVTAVLGNNPGNATLGGTVTRTPVNGVATFDNLSVSQGGSGYRLDFTAPGARKGSLAFDATGSPTNLAFASQPTSIVEKGTIPAFQVRVQATGGALATGSSMAVTVGTGANPGNATLTGTTTVNAVNGVATFSNLSLDRAGVGYTLVATASGLTNATSASFNVTSAAVLGTGRLFAISVTNRLFSVDLRSPSETRTSAPVTGLQPAETLDAIDFRPATGVLYGIGSTNRVYTIDTVTGVATVLTSTTLPLTGAARGFDFNPVADRIRIVSENGDNLRVNPDTGAVTVDVALNPGTPRAVASAYTNPFVGAAATTLYQIDSNTDSLYIQNPPNNGTLTLVGALGVDTSDVAGFDIATVSTGYAALTVGGNSALYTINLTTGAATLVGALGTENVRGIALAPVGLVAVTNANKLVTFNASNPTRIITAISVTGLQPAESLVALDYRPLDATLYGLGSTSLLYKLDLATGAATQVGTAGAFALGGTEFGFDFNPTVDLIRVVSNSDQNIRLNPNTGALAATDTDLAYAPGDPNFGADPNVVAIAYTNNSAFAGSTVLVGIDSNLDVLVVQNPANSGLLTTIGSLGVDVTQVASLDVGPDGVAYAALRTAAGTTHELYTIDLTTGAATKINAIDSAPITIRGLTSVPALASRVYAVTNANQLIAFDPATPGTTTTPLAITGLQGGETILAIDFRPATRALYALGSTSRLYTIDRGTGAATQVGTAGGFTLAGTAFGMDVNPTVDRIRVTSDLGQNIRLNPDTGALAATDVGLAYAGGDPNAGQTPSVVASAYTNDFPGATTTTLYGIDSALDILVTQNPPNNGTLNTVGALGVNVGADTSFDVTPAGDFLMAATVGGVTSLYKINPATGAATLVGAIGTGATPLAGMAYGP